MPRLNATIVVNGRFHHFHLARQLEKHGLLERIHTGYPLFKLRDEEGIPSQKIYSYPYYHGSYMLALRYGLSYIPKLEWEWSWRAKLALDAYVQKRIKKPTVLIGLSGSALKSGKSAKQLGGRYICDRGSSHISYQDQILKEEYARWGLSFRGIDPRIIERERQEYEEADLITVPSQFCVDSFVKEGVNPVKIRKISYGARLERFKKCDEPPNDEFRVLWVGGVSIRKGFMDALHAFQELRHPRKSFRVIGAVEKDMSALISKENMDNVNFMGIVPNPQLPGIYSASHVFILPSIEEGLAMVMGEALACGCPVIASEHTGARDLFEDGKEGYIVAIRSPEMIAKRLQELADVPEIRQRMSEAAIKRVNSLGGWDTYGDEVASIINKL
jgi:glycosyltransferase involved in cell wall biosynthesis